MVDSVDSDFRKDLEQRCLTILDKKGWKQFKDIVIEIHDLPTPLSGRIELTDRRIHLGICEDLPQAVDALINEESLAMAQDEVLDALFYFMVVHEYSHHSLCPGTKSDFQNIVDGCSEAIAKRESRKEKIAAGTAGIQNIFTDSVLNTVNSKTDSEKERYSLGLGLCYLFFANYQSRLMKLMIEETNRTEKNPLKRMLNNRRKYDPSKDMTLFLDSNLYSCQVDPEIRKRLMNKYGPRFFLGRQRHLERVLSVFTGDEKITNSVLEGALSDENTAYFVERLQNRSGWKQMAYDYTDVIYPFWRKPDQWLENAFSKQRQGKSDPRSDGDYSKKKSPGGTPKEGSGRVSQEKPKEKPGKQSGQTPREKFKSRQNPKEMGQEKPKDGSNYGKDVKPDKDKSSGNRPIEGNDTDYLKERQKRVKKYLRKAISPSHEPYSSPYLKHYPQLDALYRERAAKLPIFTEEENFPENRYGLLLGQEEISFSEFSPTNVDWSSTRLITRRDGTKHLELYRGKIPLPLDIDGGKETPKGIPDLAFILDRSPSMHFDPRGGNGEYHLAGLGVYGILKDLEDKGLAPLLNYLMMVFSSDTNSSGWRGYPEIDRVKQTFFDYGGESTILDPNALTTLRKSRRDNFLCFMLSDTDFNSEDNIDELIKEVELMKAEGGIGFFLFLLGRPTRFSQAVEKIGYPVQPIRTAEDFMNHSIKFSRELYGEVIKKCR